MKKIFYSLVVVMMFVVMPVVSAETIDSNEYLKLDKDNGKYTIAVIKDVGSTEFSNFFKKNFGNMLSGDITINGNDKKITYNGSTNTMIGIGGSDYTKGTAAVYNEITKKWETSDYGWFGYNHNLTFNDITFVGSESTTNLIIMYIVLPYSNITFDGCEFEAYQKAAIWTANFNSMTIKNNKFDGNSISVNEESASLREQSSSHISLCLGDEFQVGTSSYGTHQIKSINILNNEFINVKLQSTNGTGGVKIKIKNIALVSGVDEITIKNNKFINNLVDLIVGEKNPETKKPVSRPTTFDESADLNINFENNTTTNTKGLTIQSVHDTSSQTLEQRTDYITDKSSIIYNVKTDVELKKVASSKDLILSGDTPLENAFSFILTDKQYNDTTSIILQKENYSIHINKKDIKTDRINTIDDLSLNISTTIPEALKDKVKDKSVIISSNKSGKLPVASLTLITQVKAFANKKVAVNYYNETTNELELVSTVTADENGNMNIVLEHYLEYVLTPIEEVTSNAREITANPNTGDSIMVSVSLFTLSLVGIIILKKKINLKRLKH